MSVGTRPLAENHSPFAKVRAQRPIVRYGCANPRMILRPVAAKGKSSALGPAAGVISGATPAERRYEVDRLSGHALLAHCDSAPTLVGGGPDVGRDTSELRGGPAIPRASM